MSYNDNNFSLNSYGCKSVDDYLEYTRIVGDDDGGNLFTPSQYEAYKKKMIPIRMKNRLYVCWASESGLECKQVGPETKCFCEHRYKQHITDFINLPSTRPIKIPCNALGCGCKAYFYVPPNGTQLLRCKCKHSTNEHSNSGKKKCVKVGCLCQQFCTAYSCGCGMGADKHKMIIETKKERQLRGMPVGYDVPYKAMGGLTGFSSLADGYTRLDQSGIGVPSKEFFEQPPDLYDPLFLKPGNAKGIQVGHLDQQKKLSEVECMAMFEQRFQQKLRLECSSKRRISSQAK
ncbi:protein FAM221A isoform X1 [Hydra vulgaris]|uniref:protein FAM221A isoform X1 n=1 Tax=Hydra vulgaris TaxID=6087 RepID=UPI001F5FDDBE|nr:protein FAM221A-like isoform X1 [Hydra vulgaris]